MKPKAHAKEKREAMRPNWKPEKKPVVKEKPVKTPAPRLSPEEQARIEAEEARLFLEYIGKTETVKEEEATPVRKRSAGQIPSINLEDGMPLVEEAVSRMNIALQEMRCSGIRVVKLIHGYGSSGTGGRIRVGVRRELASMKKRKMIRDYFPGENFGPFDEGSRRLAEQNRALTSDPDYGSANHGITMVVI